MTTPAYCLHTNDTYAHASAEMIGRGVHQLAVVDEDDRFQGLLSMATIQARAPASNTPVSSLVDPESPIVKPDDDSFACLRLMHQAKAHAAAVIDKGHVVGIITLDDLRKDLGPDVDRVLHGRPPLREGY